MTRNGVEPSWHITVRRGHTGGWVCQFGHRKGNAGWVWDEVAVSNMDFPLTEAYILDLMYGCILEFLERRTAQ